MGRCTWCLRVRDAMENTGEWRRLYEEERFRRSDTVSVFLWFTPILLLLFFFSSSSSSSSRSSSFFLRFRLFFSLSSAVMYFFSVWEYLAVAVDEWTETALSSSLRFNLVSRLLSFFSISLSSLLFSSFLSSRRDGGSREGYESEPGWSSVFRWSCKSWQSNISSYKS